MSKWLSSLEQESWTLVACLYWCWKVQSLRLLVVTVFYVNNKQKCFDSKVCSHIYYIASFPEINRLVWLNLKQNLCEKVHYYVNSSGLWFPYFCWDALVLWCNATIIYILLNSKICLLSDKCSKRKSFNPVTFRDMNWHKIVMNVNTMKWSTKLCVILFQIWKCKREYVNTHSYPLFHSIIKKK
jgi:hypothetical protein